MKIYFKNIKHFFLTVDTNGARKKHMVNEFKEFDLNEVNPILGIGKCKSGATGFSKMIDLALKNQNRSMPFQPFVLYEDDCSKFREFPEYIELPDNADVCYIGLSKCSMNDKMWHLKSYYKHINNDVIKIFNMLATHGMIVCSASGALALQRALMEGYSKDKVWDIFFAYIQPYYNFYALKTPLVFQDSKYGGAEKATKFTISSTSDSPIPNHYINTTNSSIITCCHR
jgi:hypothetical protein